MVLLKEKTTSECEGEKQGDGPGTQVLEHDGACDVRVVRIGLLGCGTVGSAVGRQIAKANRQLAASGLRLVLVKALVRDLSKIRRDAPRGLTLTDDANAFLAESYDVVIEVLGGLEAPRALIRRLLAAGTSVISANKAVVAAHGAELAEAAAEGATQFRFEAAAIPGAALLEAISRSSNTAGVREIAAVLNGTSQFILRSVDVEGLTVDSARHRAEVLGLAEPDASRDLSGLDAADKLRLILRQAGVHTSEAIAPSNVVVDAITPGIVADARRLGGCIRQAALASVEETKATAYVGPAWVGRDHAFARLGAIENAVVIRDVFGTRTQFAGVGAGPDVTARAILNDVVASATSASRAGGARRRRLRCLDVDGNIRAAWFVHATVRGDISRASRVSEVFGSFGVWFRRLETALSGQGVTRISGLTFPQECSNINLAVEALCAMTSGQVLALPVVEDTSHG